MQSYNCLSMFMFVAAKTFGLAAEVNIVKGRGGGERELYSCHQQ